MNWVDFPMLVMFILQDQLLYYCLVSLIPSVIVGPCFLAMLTLSYDCWMLVFGFFGLVNPSCDCYVLVSCLSHPSCNCCILMFGLVNPSCDYWMLVFGFFGLTNPCCDYWMWVFGLINSSCDCWMLVICLIPNYLSSYV